MSHREQHFAGLHERNINQIGMGWKDHAPRPLKFYMQHSHPIQLKDCPVCNSKMTIYQHYPFDKKLMAVWQCKSCDRLFIFV